MDSLSNPAPEPTSSDSLFKPRRVRRHPIEETSKLRAPQLFQIEVKVRNVSACGFMAECTSPVQIGSYVSLDIPGIGPVQAQVRWQLGGSMGGMFLDPISLTRCEWQGCPAEPPLEKA
ncbi:MAG: hypothetical protein ACT4OE_09935 [Sphingosinicella sp.]